MNLTPLLLPLQESLMRLPLLLQVPPFLIWLAPQRLVPSAAVAGVACPREAKAVDILSQFMHHPMNPPRTTTGAVLGDRYHESILLVWFGGRSFPGIPRPCIAAGKVAFTTVVEEIYSSVRPCSEGMQLLISLPGPSDTYPALGCL
jgi:hypothetical protein